MYEKQKTCPEKITPKLRKDVLYRDNYTCQFTGCGVQDLTGETLDIHHLDRNRANNFRSNLLTACQTCNRRDGAAHKRNLARFAKMTAGTTAWKNHQLQLDLEKTHGENKRTIA